MQKILQTYLRRLTNLTGNNRSLLLLRLLVDQFIDIHDFNFLDNKASFHIIDQLIAGKSSVRLCSQVDPRDKDSNEVSRRLKKLHRLDKFIFEERGSKDLYVGWPFVRGKFMDNTLVRSPLLFFPVELELKANAWNLIVRKDVNLTFNKTFLLAYAYYNNIRLEEDLIERVFDDFDRDSKGFRTALYELLKKSPLEINFNPEIFQDELISFENFKKIDYEDCQNTGELKLIPESVLGIFPQAGSYLVPDYIHLIDNKEFSSIEDFFKERSFSEETGTEIKHLSFFYFLNKIKEEQTFTPYKMDAFQENALKAVKKGNSIVVQGPPGTGKSQLICSLVSDFIAGGKRVLVVCQKRAALDVVHERLQQKGIADFVALVHDFKNDRKPIFQQIQSQIEKLYEYKLKNNSLDSIQLERTFLQSSRKIDRITEELDEFKHALYDESECGVSVKELYLTSDLSRQTINLKQEYNLIKFDQLSDFLDKFRYYVLYAKKFLNEGYPWRKRKDFSYYTITDLKSIQEILEDIPRYRDRLSNETEKLLNTPVSFQEGEAIVQQAEEIKLMFDLLERGNSYAYFQHILNVSTKKADYLHISNLQKNLLGCFEGEGIENSLKSGDLGKFQITLYRMLEARRKPYKWIRWLLFSKDRPMIRSVLEKNKLTSRKRDLKILTIRLDNRLNFEHYYTKLRENKWVTDIPGKRDLQILVAWFEDVKNAILAKDIFVKIRGFEDYFKVATLELAEFIKISEKLLKILEDIPSKRMAWEQWLLSTQISDIITAKYDLEQVKDTLNHDFDSLCEFDRLKQSLVDYQHAVILKINDLLDNYTEDEIMEIFLNSLRLAWINHIETKYPVLRMVSSLKFEPMILELQQAVKEKLRVSQEIVLMKSRERTYREVSYNRLNNMTTYRDLLHQVSKKRKIWPIRKLVSNFTVELFDLIPCWMTSPESASAIFPMEKLFDVVIFDEASQCFVERGIPAMYRGKQVVIAGDANQLSPFDLYKIRWEDESEDIPELEVDSLLELAEKHLMQVQLRGHYRSRSLDLIDFSNHHFYNGNLSMIPDRHIMNVRVPAITFIKVDGIWENNCNPEEAEYVADLVFSLMKEYKDKDIGVVTFNSSQQDLIMDLVEEKAVLSGKVMPERLFIKNIENVQGDERDIIIFSLTHGPDKNGNLAMQFGSLNIIKGENRLNVAITRAREKIFIVSSFFPYEMKTEHLKNEGLRLLQKYLEYALTVSNGEYVPVLRSSLRQNPNWYLKSQLREALRDMDNFSLQISEDLPFADLAIKQEDQYSALLLTDDDSYYQSISSKEAHVYNPFSLSSKNWKFRGVFSREFWQEKEKVLESLVTFSNNLTPD